MLTPIARRCARRRRRQRFLSLGLVLGLAASSMLLLAALVFAASAHEAAPEGWHYDWGCCSQVDCSAVPDGAIRETRNGWSVELAPESHPVLRAVHRPSPLYGFFAHGDPRVRRSGDARKHACVSSSEALLCIYVLPSGS